LNQVTFALSSWQTCALQAILHTRIPGGVFAYQYKTGILNNTHNVRQKLAKSGNHDEQYYVVRKFMPRKAFST
jgi:hypothetical protein